MTLRSTSGTKTKNSKADILDQLHSLFDLLSNVASKLVPSMISSWWQANDAVSRAPTSKMLRQSSAEQTVRQPSERWRATKQERHCRSRGCKKKEARRYSMAFHGFWTCSLSPGIPQPPLLFFRCFYDPNVRIKALPMSTFFHVLSNPLFACFNYMPLLYVCRLHMIIFGALYIQCLLASEWLNGWLNSTIIFLPSYWTI